MKNALLPFFVLLLLAGCQDQPKQKDGDVNVDAQVFIDEYTSKYVDLYYESAKAEWRANTYIVEGDTITDKLVEEANQALSDYTGSEDVIKKVKVHLENGEKLEPVIHRQLDAILYQAANNPATVSELVAERIKAENTQNKELYGFDFQVNGESVTTNEIDNALKTETDPGARLANWEASKEVGKGLKDGLVNLRDLRNKTVQALGYDDYFSYQVSDYGMTRSELTETMQQMVRDVWPLYRQLHTWARYELAERYGAEEVPDMLPAHWLPNRWGQDWSSLVEVEGLDIDGALSEKKAEWIVEQGEGFYKSMGLGPLPSTFYERSDMYPLPDSAEYKKNNHASAWHLDLDKDVRCLMSVVPNAEWYETVHHELGHIYYYMLYTSPEVPPLLRGGANRGFHEAIGSLLGLAAMQKPFLAARGIVDAEAETDEMQILLREALNYIVFIPWSAGVMTQFEDALYADDLAESEFNGTWWDLKRNYQGIVPPSERGEDYCDAASKTHINNDAAQYYDYGISYILLFQFHDHIARNILGEDPHATNYYGRKDVGEFLRKVLSPGANCDWRELLQESVGTGMSARPMLEYFAPLKEYLEKENEGRKHTLPESI